MFGKLENGRFIKAKHFIQTEKETIINPTGNMYEKYGYKKVVEEEVPELAEGQYTEAYYEETDAEIIKRYRIMEAEDDGFAEIHEKAEAYDIITGVSS